MTHLAGRRSAYVVPSAVFAQGCPSQASRGPPPNRKRRNNSSSSSSTHVSPRKRARTNVEQDSEDDEDREDEVRVRPQQPRPHQADASEPLTVAMLCNPDVLLCHATHAESVGAVIETMQAAWRVGGRDTLAFATRQFRGRWRRRCSGNDDDDDDDESDSSDSEPGNVDDDEGEENDEEQDGGSNAAEFRCTKVLDTAYAAALLPVTRLYAFVMEMSAADPDEHADAILEHDVHRAALVTLMHTIRSLRDMLFADLNVRRLAHGETLQTQRDVNLFVFDPPDLSNAKPLESLMVFLYAEARRLGYRRYKGDCYEAIETESGRKTHAWRNVCSVKEFMNRTIKRHSNWQQWCNLNAGRNRHTAEVVLLESLDEDFPDLKPDRHVFAFRNALLDIRTCTAYDYETDGHKIPPDLTACNYLDMDFDMATYAAEMGGIDAAASVSAHSSSSSSSSSSSARNGKDEQEDDEHIEPEPEPDTHDWRRLRTDVFQSILDYQGIPSEAADWLYISFGRMLFPLKKHDGWDTIPFLKGIAKTGKSLLLKLFFYIYRAKDVGVLSSNVEPQYALGPLLDKFVFYCSEVRRSMKLPVEEFLVMASGDPVSAATKYKDPAMLDQWEIPFALAGNEMFSSGDTGGSHARRTLVFEFLKKVKKTDPNLPKKLKAETPRLILKCAMAYLSTVERHGDTDIWDLVPEYFHRTSRNLKKGCNSLFQFVCESENLRIAKGEYMAKDDFLRLYKEYCQDNSLKVQRFSDHFEDVFESLGLVFTNKAETREWNGRPQRKKYIDGICLRRGFGQDGEDGDDNNNNQAGVSSGQQQQQQQQQRGGRSSVALSSSSSAARPLEDASSSSASFGPPMDAHAQASASQTYAMDIS